MTQDIFHKVYELLDRNPLAAVDCGEICGKRCCCYMFPEEKQYGMELIPGEETIFPMEADWHQYEELNSTEYDYPPEWEGQGGCIQIKCSKPCPREQRPVNCRLFPFQICKIEGEYHLILTDNDLGYSCSLVEKPDLIHPEFIRCAVEAAKLLLTIPKYRQLVDWDSEAVDTEAIKLKYSIST